MIWSLAAETEADAALAGQWEHRRAGAQPAVGCGCVARKPSVIRLSGTDTGRRRHQSGHGDAGGHELN